MPPRESPFPMIAPREALDVILARAATPLGTEEVGFLEARGRVLAEDIRADQDLPALPRSSVDGYAVTASDTSPVRDVLEEVTAGHLGHVRVQPGTAVHIMTGGALPDGADAVVMVEEVDESPPGRATLHHFPKAGENVHPVGMDLTAGQPMLDVGTVLGPAEVGLLATVGKTRVRVYRRPRVAVLATGDEVVEPDQAPPPGSVRDSNRYALIAAAMDAGAEVVWHAHGRDEEELLEGLVREALDTADVLLTSGGVSMGTRDLMKPILQRVADVHFGRINFKPGKPLTFATTPNGRYAFGLPGFPVSSLVTFEVFVRPALLSLGGRRQVLRPRIPVELGHRVRPDGTRLEYMRAAVRLEDGRLVARDTGVQASSRLMSIAGANALLEIEPGGAVLPEGSQVPALLLADLHL